MIVLTTIEGTRCAVHPDLITSLLEKKGTVKGNTGTPYLEVSLRAPNIGYNVVNTLDEVLTLIKGLPND